MISLYLSLIIVGTFGALGAAYNIHRRYAVTVLLIVFLSISILRVAELGLDFALKSLLPLLSVLLIVVLLFRYDDELEEQEQKK